MPNMKANGFSLFAEHMRPSLETKLNVQFNTFYEVIKAATPYWAKIDNEEKRQWKNRAKSYMRSDDYYARQRGVRIRKVSNNMKNAKTKKPGEKNATLSDDDEDFDLLGEMENAREQDIFELPGPVQDIQVIHPSPSTNSKPSVKSTQMQTNLDGDLSGFDLCEGGLSKSSNPNNKEPLTSKYFYSNSSSQTNFFKQNKRGGHKYTNAYQNNKEVGRSVREDYGNYSMKTDARGDSGYSYGGGRQEQSQYPDARLTIRRSRFLMLSVKMFKVHEGLRGIQHCVNSPAEVGLVEFTLNDGITDVFWHVFGPEPLPDNVAQGVQMDSDRTHGIPASGCMYSDNDTEKVLRAIFSRWNPDLLPESDKRMDRQAYYRRGGTPMLCVEAERANIATTLQLLLERLSNNQQSEWVGAVRQLKSELMHVRDFLRGLAAQNRFNLTSTRPLQILQTLNQCPEKVVTPFDFHPGTLCDLHNKLQMSCCAISTAKKTCYLIFQVFCRHFHVQPTCKHFPDFEGQSFKDPNLGLSERSLIDNPYIFHTSDQVKTDMRVFPIDENQEDMSAFDLVDLQIKWVKGQTVPSTPEAKWAKCNNMSHQPLIVQEVEKFTPLPIQSLFPNL